MASRPVPVPGPMADPGTPAAMADQAAMADPGTPAAMADPGIPAAMASQGARAAMAEQVFHILGFSHTVLSNCIQYCNITIVFLYIYFTALPIFV